MSDDIALLAPRIALSRPSGSGLGASRWPLLCSVALCAGLIAWLFQPMAAALWQAWSSDPNYSHGPLVVLAAVGLAIHAVLSQRASHTSPKRQQGFPEAPSLALRASVGATRQDQAFGIAMIVVALLLHGVAWLLDFTLLDVVSFVTLLLAVLLAVGGQSLRRVFGFAVLLLLFAAPLPVAWYQPLALGLQKLVSSLATNIFALCGLSVYREGNVIHLSGLALEVGAACSGMRQLTAYLALGAALGYLSGRGRGFSAALIGLSAVTAVGANLLRILLTGFLMLVAGPAAAAGVFHTLEGLATLALGAAGLFAAALVLARLQDRWRQRVDHVPREEEHEAASDVVPALALSSRVPLALPVSGRRCSVLSLGEDTIQDADRRLEGDNPIFVPQKLGQSPAHLAMCAVVLVLLAAAAGAQSFAQRTVAAEPDSHAVALSGTLSSLPRDLGSWQGIDVPPPADVGWADQYLRRDYRHRQTGQVVMVWIAYSYSGRDRAHHPEICMDVAGRTEDRRRRAELPLAGGPPIAELIFGQPGSTLCTWYWHYAMPHVRSDSDSLLAQTYHRARQRRGSVTVELISNDETSLGRAAARQLVALVDEALRPLLPPGATRGSQRLPVGMAAQNMRPKLERGNFNTPLLALRASVAINTPSLALRASVASGHLPIGANRTRI